MKGLGAFMDWAYIIPAMGSIQGGRRMMSVDGEHAACPGELKGQEGPR